MLNAKRNSMKLFIAGSKKKKMHEKFEKKKKVRRRNSVQFLNARQILYYFAKIDKNYSGKIPQFYETCPTAYSI